MTATALEILKRIKVALSEKEQGRYEVILKTNPTKLIIEDIQLGITSSYTFELPDKAKEEEIDNLVNRILKDLGCRVDAFETLMQKGYFDYYCDNLKRHLKSIINDSVEIDQEKLDDGGIIIELENESLGREVLFAIPDEFPVRLFFYVRDDNGLKVAGILRESKHITTLARWANGSDEKVHSLGVSI